MGIQKIEGCARCKKGDIAIDKDQYGWYEYCLQCGYMHDLIDVVESGQQRAGDLKERQRRVGIPNKGKQPAMGDRVYILLDIVDSKAEKAIKVLRKSPGVVIADALEGPPDVIIVMEAPERQQLAEMTVQALASVETITDHVTVLPTRDSISLGEGD